MINRNRKIRFRRKKSPKGWVYLLILALVIFGIKFFWFRPAGPVLNGDLGGPPLTTAEAALEPAPLAAGQVSARPVLERTLGLWARALSSGDYSQFHQILSSGWREQDDPKRLAAAYQPLYPHRELMEFFPRRGKLVVLESRPLTETENSKNKTLAIRDTLGPESPWLVRGEWRKGRSALGFNLNLVWEADEWRPAGLVVEVYKLDLQKR
ncbi:MAG: hypothetical protein LBI10_08985 [Deltaproteobacteria bacterium]|jgi:hypothetical protein|nr:hypothetical protein [Deltaproteobacteria bacterium]